MSGPYSQQYLDEYRGGILTAVAATFIVLETIFALLRYQARRQTTAVIGWDDVLIPLAWFTNLGLCVLGITMVFDAGVGRHLVAVLEYHPEQLTAWAKSLYALEWLYLASVALPKTSILCLYLRIFTNRAARIACYTLIGVIVANWIAFILAATFQCTPVAYQWDKTIPGGNCFDIIAFYKASSGPNIVTDAIILVLPISTVWRLKAPLVRKLGLMFVFLTASAGLVASCIRFWAFFQTDAFVDNTWASVVLVSWSIVEPGMYLIAACAVALRPIFALLTPQWLKALLIGTHGRKSGYSKPSRNNGVRLDALPPGQSNSGFVKIYHEEDDNVALTRTAFPSGIIRTTEYDVERGSGP
ncbi:hypothetical protein MMC17_007025 [Xylographa soralifera]|nr:hypothetical protein [Xylographa soralifera]